MSHAVQIYLDDADYEALTSWVNEKGWTLSQAVRVALRALTRPKPTDPLLAASGMIEGLPADLSERVDQYLDLTFTAEPTAKYGAKPKSKRRARKAVRR